jgi:ubiquinone/menaquinone biosynthesis C-methylase UbiE
LGGLIARVMARETAHANRRALEILDLTAEDRVLEIGFGHGATLRRAADLVTGGFLAGIDHSDAMLRLARRVNAQHLESGRMELKLADSERIPYPDDKFTKIYAVHTIYFWPTPQRHLGEILRVAAPGGRLVLGYHPREDSRFADAFPPSVYVIRPVAAVEEMTRAAGFRVFGTETKDGSDGLLAWTTAEKER